MLLSTSDTIICSFDKLMSQLCPINTVQHKASELETKFWRIGKIRWNKFFRNYNQPCGQVPGIEQPRLFRLALQIALELKRPRWKGGRSCSGACSRRRLLPCRPRATFRALSYSVWSPLSSPSHPSHIQLSRLFYPKITIRLEGGEWGRGRRVVFQATNIPTLFSIQFSQT